VGLHFNGDRLGTGSAPSFTTDVLLVIDRSGSMGDGSGSPLADARSAAAGFVSTLVWRALRVGVVSFNHEPSTVYPVSSNMEDILRAIGNIRGSGGTEIAAALQLAWQELQRAPPSIPAVGRRAIILLSDGL